jgi:hypothetical protein
LNEYSLGNNELRSQDEIEQILNIVDDLKLIKVFQLNVSNNGHITRIDKGVFLKGLQNLNVNLGLVVHIRGHDSLSNLGLRIHPIIFVSFPFF